MKYHHINFHFASLPLWYGSMREHTAPPPVAHGCGDGRGSIRFDSHHGCGGGAVAAAAAATCVAVAMNFGENSEWRTAGGSTPPSLPARYSFALHNKRHTPPLPLPLHLLSWRSWSLSNATRNSSFHRRETHGAEQGRARDVTLTCQLWTLRYKVLFMTMASNMTSYLPILPLSSSRQSSRLLSKAPMMER